MSVTTPGATVGPVAFATTLQNAVLREQYESLHAMISLPQSYLLIQVQEIYLQVSSLQKESALAPSRGLINNFRLVTQIQERFAAEDYACFF